MTSKTFEIGSLKQYKYVVILSEYNGSILLSRHKNRTTWETQGGHIEFGEQPIDAAKRELYEESGAIDYDIEPLCDYWAGVEGTDDWANGMVFRAVIRKLGDIPESEMAETKQFDELPRNLTYPQITLELFRYLFQSR
jgi:8-oxo-dGTP diphosphatase